MSGRIHTSRRGFTMVEVMVFAAIAAIPAAVTWNMMLTSGKQATHVSSRLTALSAAQVAVEALRDDLGQLCYFPDRGPGIAGEAPSADAKHELALLKFRAYDFKTGGGDLYGSGTAEKGRLACEKIEYRFDPESHKLLRNGKQLGAGRFLSVEFHPMVSPVEGGLAPATNRMGVVLVLGPEEKLDRGPEAIADSEKVVLAFSIGLPRKTAAEAYPSWNVAAWDAAPAVEE